jgi:hypothetical protein
MRVPSDSLERLKRVGVKMTTIRPKMMTLPISTFEAKRRETTSKTKADSVIMDANIIAT